MHGNISTVLQSAASVVSNPGDRDLDAICVDFQFPKSTGWGISQPLQVRTLRAAESTLAERHRQQLDEQRQLADQERRRCVPTAPSRPSLRVFR